MTGNRRQAIVDAAESLGSAFGGLLQDVKRGGDGDGAGDDDRDAEVILKEGVSKDRILSVYDPLMRHGH